MKEEAEERCYHFPHWVTDEMKENFYSMWRCSNRTPVNYYENDLTALNGREVVASYDNGSTLVGEYYHKWNNIGWLRLSGKTFVVFNAKAV